MPRPTPSPGLCILLLAGSLTVMPGAVILPILGEIEQQFQLSNDYLLIGSLGSIHYLTVALFCPLLGILADRIGRVRVLVPSLFLFALFGIAGTWADSVLELLAARMLLGAATGGIAAASLGLLAQMYEAEADRSQAIALASSAITMANIAYPLLAGLVGREHWQVAFYLYGIGLPLAVAAALRLPDRSTAASFLGGQNRLGAVVSSPQVICLLITLSLTSAVAYATVFNLSLYLNSKTDPSTIGMVLTSLALGSAAVSAFGLRVINRRLTQLNAIGLGFGLMVLALVMLPVLHQVALLLPIVILFGVGLGIVIPSHYAALANITPVDFHSTVLATGTGLTFLGQFLAPALFNVLLQASSPISTFYAGAAVSLGMALLLAASLRWLSGSDRVV